MKILKVLLLNFLTFLFSIFSSTGQETLPDSIIQFINSDDLSIRAKGLMNAAHYFYYQEDSIQYIEYSNKFKNFEFKNTPDSTVRKTISTHRDFLLNTFQYSLGIKYLNHKIKSAREKNEFEDAALFHRLIFAFHYYTFQYDSSTYHIDKSIAIYKTLNNQKEIGELTIRKAGVSYVKGNHQEAIDLAHKSIQIFKKSENHDRLALAYLQLGNIFYFLSDYDESKQYYNLSYASFVKNKDDQGKFRALSNIGLINVKLKNYRESIEQQLVALSYFDSKKKELEKGNAYHFLSSGHFGLNHLDSARYYNQMAIQSDYQSKNIIGLGEGFLMETKILRKEKKPIKALIAAQKCFSISDSMQYFSAIKDISLEIAYLYEELGEIDSSFKYLKLHNQIRDSLDVDPKKLKNYAIKHQFQVEETHFELLLAKEKALIQEKQNKRQEAQLVVAIVVAIVAILLLVLAIIILFRNKILSEELANKQNLITSELEIKESLLNEIHHRVKNNLQVISSMLSLQTQYISDFHVQKVISDCRSRINSMSLIHESLYKKTDGLETAFSTYVKVLIPQLIDTYMVDESKIKSNMDLQEIYLNLDESIPCGLLINEIVSNALKHAFPKEKNGKINIKLRKYSDIIYLTIADDGVGFNSEEELESQDSFGFLLIETLVKQLEAEMKVINKNGVHYDIRWSSIS